MKALGFSILGLIVVVFVVLMINNNTGTLRFDYLTADSNGHEGGVMEPIQSSPESPKAKPPKVLTARPNEPYIVIDRYANRLFLRTDDSLLLESSCSTGSGAELFDSLSGRHWRFDTPAGIFVVHSMLKDPWWRKPDWAFVEEGLPMPKSEPERFDANMMGDYAIGFGDGYYVHGTIYERLLGVSVTHGCVRLGAEDLKKVWGKTRMGTRIYVY